MAVWEAIFQIPWILPVLAILAGAVVATIFSLALVLKRARLVERIQQAEVELKRARDQARGQDGLVEKPPATVIVSIHDRLVSSRQDLRRTHEQAKLSRFILAPLLVGAFLGIGHIVGGIRDLGHSEQVTAQFQRLAHELEDRRAKGQTIQGELALQAMINAQMAREVEQFAREKDMLQQRLMRAEQLLAEETRERIELEVLVGKAEQRLAELEESQHHEEIDTATFPSSEEPPTPPEQVTGTESTLDVSREETFEESDLSPDDRMRVAVDATSLYTGRLKGQIAFEGRQRRSRADRTGRHIYVLVRWGVSSWIVTGGRATVNSNGVVEGAFRVILPISTIRTLDVTAIATDKVYRRYQRVRLPDSTWKASTARIAVHRS